MYLQVLPKGCLVYLALSQVCLASPHAARAVAPTTSVAKLALSTSSASPVILPPYVPGDGYTMRCPANDGSLVAVGNETYRVQCYLDFSSHDLQLNYTQSLEACTQICAVTDGCEAGVFLPGTAFNGPCYLKTEAVQPTVNMHAMGFYHVKDRIGRHSTVSTFTYTSKTSTSTSGTPTSTSKPSTAMSKASTPALETSASASVAHNSISRERTTSAKHTSTESVTTSMVVVTRTALPPTTSPSTTRKGPSTAASTTNSTTDSTDNPVYLPCGVLNHKSNLFYLRSHVIFGPSEFENLYLEGLDPNGASSIPALSKDREKAGRYFFDASSISVALYHGSCEFSGLVMVPGHSGLAWSNVLISGEVGTARMSIDWNNLIWDNDRFGSWLVCRKDDAGFQLYYWDTITNRGVETDKCAKIQLLVENA